MVDVVGERGAWDWMILPLKRYADFSGRSRRKEYWLFVLLIAIVAMFAIFILPALGLLAADSSDDGLVALLGAGPLLIFMLAIIVPSLAVQVRRFHDQGKSGWMVLLGFIPFVGGIIVFVFMLLEGEKGPNQYGPDPKGNSAVDPNVFA